jgi:heme A synthase
MKKRKRKGYEYKFAKKAHSFRGFLALSLAAVSIIIGIVLIVISYQNNGSSNAYFGSGGLFALVIALSAFILGLLSLGEEESYRWFPVAGTIASFIALGGWTGLYVVGFLL